MTAGLQTKAMQMKSGAHTNFYSSAQWTMNWRKFLYQTLTPHHEYFVLCRADFQNPAIENVTQVIINAPENKYLKERNERKIEKKKGK